MKIIEVRRRYYCNNEHEKSNNKEGEGKEGW